mmetsp:Transcript_38691/g.39108  ORF Transcript_38691/g.39108 Transcript_38691/m.39108 type:complete len:93 (+) Transcript_38691:1063-1341(+)
MSSAVAVTTGGLRGSRWRREGFSANGAHCGVILAFFVASAAPGFSIRHAVFLERNAHTATILNQQKLNGACMFQGKQCLGGFTLSMVVFQQW